ncbi:MAG: hypothetical protein ACFE96_14530 [Candidatus Hermodarchaeota archaeon]
MTRNKSSKKFFYLMILISLSSLILSPTCVKAQEETSGEIADQAFIINPDWLSVQATEFGGQSFDYTGKLDRLTVDIGGYGMSNFINHGEIAYDSETETHVYMAEMIFPVSVVMYTDCMITDVYPDYYTYTSNHEWLKLKTFRTWFFGAYKDGIVTNEYEVKYKNIATGSIDSQEYDGNLRLKAEITPDLPIEEGGTITINGATFNVPDIRVFIESANMVERSYGVCDDPQNFYTDNDGVIEVRKEDLTDLDYSHNSGEAKDQCGDGLESNHAVPYEGKTTAKDEIRWSGVHDRERYYGVTYTSDDIGQSFASSPSVGTTWSRADDLSDYDEVFEFDVHTRIKPNIFYDMERFELRYSYLLVDRYEEILWPEYGLCEIREQCVDTRTRIIGLGVQNLFIKMKYELKATMLLSIQPTSEEGESILEDPEVYQGDILWDNTIGGTTDAKATVTSPRTWIDDIADTWSDLFGGAFDYLDHWLNTIWDGWDDFIDWGKGFWDNLIPSISDWLSQNLWIILIGIALIVGVALLIYFLPRIMKGTAQAYGEHKRQRIETERYRQNQHR